MSKPGVNLQEEPVSMQTRQPSAYGNQHTGNRGKKKGSSGLQSSRSICRIKPQGEIAAAALLGTAWNCHCEAFIACWEAPPHYQALASVHS